MSDLNSIFNVEEAADKGAFMHLENPTTGEKLYTEDKKPIGMDLVGMDSAEYRRKESQIMNRKLGNMKKMQKGMTVEKIKQENAEKLAACVVKCHNINFGGEDITPKNVEAALIQYAALYEQVSEFVEDRRNFLTA